MSKFMFKMNARTIHALFGGNVPTKEQQDQLQIIIDDFREKEKVQQPHAGEGNIYVLETDFEDGRIFLFMHEGDVFIVDDDQYNQRHIEYFGTDKCTCKFCIAN